MVARYESAWWKAKIPRDWDTNEDEICVTFKSQTTSGAVQVSAASKGTDQVSDADLKEFAGQRIANKRINAVKTPRFEGIHVEYLLEDTFWREWWLRAGRLMVYVTYNIEKKSRDVERATIDEFINSLEPSFDESSAAKASINPG
jgi:hypothetical protein